VLADIQPSGAYLMEDFYYAGGLRGLLTRLTSWLHLDRTVAAGWSLGKTLAGAEVYSPDVIRPLDNPLSPEGGLAVLHGNLAPAGAVIKHIAADPRLLKHTGPAVVFTDYADMQRRIDTVAVTPDSVLVLRGAGPQGGPGMPEQGMLPSPSRCWNRESATWSGSPTPDERHQLRHLRPARRPRVHVGGPLAVVRDGDLITLDTTRASPPALYRDVPGRRSNWRSPPENSPPRLAAWTPHPSPTPAATRRCTPSTSCRRTRAATSTSWPTRRNPEPEAG